MQVQVYLFLDGRGDEAIEFYRKTLGAEVTMMMRFKDSPSPEACAPVSLDKIMHSELRIGDTTLMLSDGRVTNKPEFKGFALSLAPKTVADAERLFKALGEGGQVQMPMEKTFWSPAFGMLADRFGVSWMISVPSA